ncbi:hypothetical protein GH714_033265 [Hevea brasiliensis]|uniref:NB-ARC domain-containing protein n=1 Tax=Hevea brasiliensis TaxID=3981 RepID=A0A6A6M7J8_HEVBR|nr:hypothetical protein GH714_033265 [Hevea brasiliensis]
MAETLLLFNIAKSVLGKLGSLALKEFFLAWGLESDLEKIKDNLEVINSVLLDAEKQRSQNPWIEVRLRNLKEDLYDIEDVVGEFECEALRRKVVKSGNNTRKVRRFFSSSNPLAFRFRMGRKLNKIRKRVDEIATLKTQFGLTGQSFDRDIIHGEREMTHSFVDASNVIGREQDTDNIIETLLQSVDGENVSIIPIVGIGGIGKTALAKLVYNDQRVISHFGVKLWVCVSQVFELDKVLIKILNSASPDQRYMDLDMDQLQNELREALEGRKYLLILDDVWCEDPKKWNDLKTLLTGGANGSKIVVTTRSNRVAEIMGTVSAYNLSVLPDQDCLSLFFKCAFKGQQEKQNPKLTRIGEEIVRKCKGVPLAVITLGSQLYCETDERRWEYIKDNEIWKSEQKGNDILPALRLSYEHLPSYLKRCFAYCSIFPKDYEFDDIELVYFWMANGFLQSSNDNEDLEDVGLRYFKELCSRCFFQDLFEYPGRVNCKMHDLIHDLALSISQNGCSMVVTNTQQIPKSVRHISFPYPKSLVDQDLPTSLQIQHNVRTISFLNKGKEGISSKRFIKTCCLRSPYLRVLDLAFSKFEVLPRRIGDLKQLKYLSLGGNRLIRRLPNSICKLQSLQVLLLVGCWSLEELPKDMKYMINLRWLWIITKQKNLPTGGIGCLKSLQFLYISLCNNLECLFEDMQGLKKLRRLVISSCRRLISLPQSIKCLTALDTLCIVGCENLDLTMGKEKKINT